MNVLCVFLFIVLAQHVLASKRKNCEGSGGQPAALVPSGKEAHSKKLTGVEPVTFGGSIRHVLLAAESAVLEGDFQRMGKWLKTVASDPHNNSVQILGTLFQRLADSDTNFEKLDAFVQVLSKFDSGQKALMAEDAGLVFKSLLVKYPKIKEERFASYTAYLLRLAREQQSIITPKFFAKGLEALYSSQACPLLSQSDKNKSQLVTYLILEMSVEDLYEVNKVLVAPFDRFIRNFRECYSIDKNLTLSLVGLASEISRNARQVAFAARVLKALVEQVYFPTVLATLIAEYL